MEKWLDLLKASGGQLFGIALGCAAILALRRYELIPVDLDAPWPQAIFVVGVVAFSLSLVSAAPPARKLWQHITLPWRRKAAVARAQKEVRAYIPHMTERDRDIIGYLLSKN